MWLLLLVSVIDDIAVNIRRRELQHNNENGLRIMNQKDGRTRKSNEDKKWRRTLSKLSSVYHRLPLSSAGICFSSDNDDDAASIDRLNGEWRARVCVWITNAHSTPFPFASLSTARCAKMSFRFESKIFFALSLPSSTKNCLELSFCLVKIVNGKHWSRKKKSRNSKFSGSSRALNITQNAMVYQTSKVQCYEGNRKRFRHCFNAT